MTLENTIALVTGGSRGIGRAMLARLAAEGAKVTFVYEKFLGVNVAGTGETGGGSIAQITVPLDSPTDPPGIPLGFYRIQVTMDGENIPAKYNTETTLGMMVDSPTRGAGPSFDLAY